jgi:hypothetical protein
MDALDGWTITDEVHCWKSDEMARIARLAVNRVAEREAAEREAWARAATLATLRPGLRWAARRPRALRVLKRLGLWHPPTLHVDTGGRVICWSTAAAGLGGRV